MWVRVGVRTFAAVVSLRHRFQHPWPVENLCFCWVLLKMGYYANMLTLLYEKLSEVFKLTICQLQWFGAQRFLVNKVDTYRRCKGLMPLDEFFQRGMAARLVTSATKLMESPSYCIQEGSAIIKIFGKTTLMACLTQ
jgi:hypothetical protein